MTYHKEHGIEPYKLNLGIEERDTISFKEQPL